MYVTLNRYANQMCAYIHCHVTDFLRYRAQPKFDESDLHRREKSATTVPSTSTPHDVLSTTFTESLEDTKPVSSAPPHMRSAASKPSPLRNAILSSKALRPTHEGEQGPTLYSRTGVGDVKERSVQFKREIPYEGRIALSNQARPLHPDRSPPHEVQPPQQASRSSHDLSSTSSPRRSHISSVVPPPPGPKASDSDPDIYFNDEDNEALLAIEDSAMQGIDSSGALEAVEGNTDRNATRNESSRGAGNTRSQVDKPLHCTTQPPRLTNITGVS
jgi:hypothetical protein